MRAGLRLTPERGTRARTANRSPPVWGASPGSPLWTTQRLAGNQTLALLLEGHRLQPKLHIGAPNDRYELEADRVADRVMRMPEPTLQRTCACGGTCAGCRHQEDQEGEGMLHRSPTGRSPDVAPPVVHEVLRAPGTPLDGATRGYMEPRFGRAFAQVRVHTDERAAASARAVGAVAYTVGSDIVFGGGQYAPATPAGRRLLAHELTHVVQQAAEGPRGALQCQLYPPVPIVIWPGPQPVEVSAVDARQETGTPWYAPWRYTGPVTNFFRGDVTMTSISTMVANVLRFLGSRSMHRLNVMDHGNQNGVEIGDDWLASAADVAPHAGTLGRLRSHFAGGAFVHMQNCEAGQNHALICALAAAFGVPVYAGTGYHNPIYGFNTGDYVRCDPSGTFNPNAGRPSTPPATPEMA